MAVGTMDVVHVDERTTKHVKLTRKTVQKIDKPVNFYSAGSAGEHPNNVENILETEVPVSVVVPNLTAQKATRVPVSGGVLLQNLTETVFTVGIGLIYGNGRGRLTRIDHEQKELRSGRLV